MPNLEQSIADWRKTAAKTPNLGSETLDELECHLRETAGELIESGINETEAFRQAVNQLGLPLTLASEFRKLDPPIWLPARVLTSLFVFLALGVAAEMLLLFHQHHSTGSGILLASHVFTVTLGYATTLLLGVLGICFVCQRSYSDFSSRRLESISRVSVTFARLAASLTVIGTVLGMFWAKSEWGRLWRWDPREVGALCVILWLGLFLAAHRSGRLSPRVLLVWSILSSTVVCLAWFGPPLLPGLHAYGFPNGPWILLVAIISNFLFILLGLASAGWLRLRRA